MSLVNAVGNPSYGTAGFIPQYYSRVWNKKFYKSTKLTKTLQSAYFDEMKNAGDKVTVPVTPNVRGGPFTTGGSMNFKIPVSTPIEVTLSRQYAWGFVIYDQNENRTHLNLDAAFKGDAVKQTEIYTETEFLMDIVTKVDTTNTGATAGAVSGGYSLGTAASPVKLEATNVVEVVQGLSSCLNENNLTGMKHITLPELMRSLVLNSELKAANLAGDKTSQLRTGKILEIDGADFYSTNCYGAINDDDGASLLAGITCVNSAGNTVACTGADALHPTPIFCWTQDFAAYGGVLSKIESTRIENGFGTKYKGLYIYDWKVLVPTALAVAWVYKG
jgi:hypothetical protein